MSTLDIEDRLSILEMAADIASKAAQNPSIDGMIDFQEELIERLYRKMTALIEEDELDDDDDDDDEG
ncbi:MAG: hypothetical protein LJE69_10110 [Thiohalocapsa sp.]|uniref:hypothetical protein n=1 Tax=Thiohalocapsa sp. TaxID=2497641 RepID=UPI0025DDABE5|nr:hypothetical protein [Thiohalocapsa sp.]MCG6941591.1 hypothetical protein [Thiohalocapsa sp.]